MNFKQSFLLAIKSLATSKVRALLTMLGIIIGVAAVIIIISLGDGMQKLMNDEFESYGMNQIQVQAWDTGSSRTIVPQDMFELVQDNPRYLTAVSPMISVGKVTVRTAEESFTPNSTNGVSEDYAAICGISLQEGRFLQYVDVLRSQKVCVIGSYINREYFDGRGLGKSVAIAGYHYQIVGVLEESAESRKGTDDDQVLIPYTHALQISGAPASFYFFSSASKDTAAASRGIIEKYLKGVYGNEDMFMVITLAEILDMASSMTNITTAVLAAIAAISLLVGGIGIMNIMLVSVTERTREIGIRKSLGAKKRDVRSQFIIEAGTTSAVGGILGIGLGVAVARVVGLLIASLDGLDGFTAVISPGAVGIAFGVSVGVGILFGYLPANKAAKLNPIDALRYD